LRGAVCTGLSLGIAGWTCGQDVPNSSLYSGRLASLKQNAQPAAATSAAGGMAAAGPPPPTSWYQVPLQPPKEVRVNDIITIRVDMGARLGPTLVQAARPSTTPGLTTGSF
jgi:hypothetical protein